MNFLDGAIDGLIFKAVQRHEDARGWLLELFRVDEVAAELHPRMAYVSQTLPGVLRGPHEHAEQADHFIFAGPGDFRLTIWDNRAASGTYRHRQVVVVGQSNPTAVIIPPGVVHAYRNIGAEAAWVFNFPNRLYAGEGRRQPVDEIRHELDPHSPFIVD